MANEVCKAGSYSLQCYPHNDPVVAFSVLLSASGTHRTTGYRSYLVRADDTDGVPIFTLRHERTDQPDLEMMTEFVATFAFKSSVDIKTIKAIDAKGEHVVEVHNLPTLISSCSS